MSGEADSQDDISDARGKFPELARAKERLAANDGAGAEAILTGLVKQDDAPLGAHILYARVLFRRKKMGAALAASRAIEKSFPRNWRASAQLGQTLLWLNRAEEAQDQLSAACELFPGELALRRLYVESKLLAGDPRGALEAIRAAGEQAEDVRLLTLKIVSLDAAQRHGRAKELFRTMELPPDGLEELYRNVVWNYSTRGKTKDAVALAERAHALLPESAALTALCAEQLFQAERYEDTVQVVSRFEPTASTAATSIRVRLLKVKARALQSLKDADGAIAALECLLALESDDQDALRDLYVLHQKAGHTDKMRAYGRQLSGAGAKRMPETLAAGLAGIQSGETRRPLSDLDQKKLDWAWEIADKTRWSKHAWLERVRWGQAADRLLRGWWLNLPERASEIDTLIDRPVHSALDDIPVGARCLCAGTHMGPLAAAVRHLQTCGRPFRGFGFAGADPVVGDAPPMRIASRGGAGIRELLDEIGKGTLIGFAAETPEREKNLSFDFHGRKVLLPTFVPRLIHRQKTASLWWHALWRDGRIVIELERLPDPTSGEDIDTFCQRWATAYLAHIETVVQGAPENLGLGPGIWTNVGR